MPVQLTCTVLSFCIFVVRVWHKTLTAPQGGCATMRIFLPLQWTIPPDLWYHFTEISVLKVLGNAHEPYCQECWYSPWTLRAFDFNLCLSTTLSAQLFAHVSEPVDVYLKCHCWTRDSVQILYKVPGDYSSIHPHTLSTTVLLSCNKYTVCAHRLHSHADIDRGRDIKSFFNVCRGFCDFVEWQKPAQSVQICTDCANQSFNLVDLQKQ